MTHPEENCTEALKAALEHALTQLRDLQAGYPERELHEPIATTIERIEKAGVYDLP